MNNFYCGGGGIRTPEEFPLAGFQDRCNQPGSATPPIFSIILKNVRRI